ncbi:carbohydrate sulfotransferase 8-like isoform X3 [Arapaima gigas]
MLEGLASYTQDIQHNAVHYGNQLCRLDSFKQQGITHHLESYTKVLFVQELLKKLLFAFRDKFENPKTYYHLYLLDVHWPVHMDIHWEPDGNLCSPCLLDFDVISKFKTMQWDADFLLHITGAPPHNLMQQVYDFYYMDYQMFNYSKLLKDLC